MNHYRMGAFYPERAGNGSMPMLPPMTQEPALAMAYVMVQCWGQTYEPATALKRGTIFPELDLPFYCGGVNR